MENKDIDIVVSELKQFRSKLKTQAKWCKDRKFPSDNFTKRMKEIDNLILSLRDLKI